MGARAIRTAVAAVAALALASGVGAGGPLAAQESHLVVVVGLGGDPEYRETFHGYATRLVDAARERWGLPPDRVVYLGESPDLDPRMSGRSTAENLQRVLGDLSTSTGPDDVVAVVLIGHGSYNNGETRFNLPGPDLSPEEFALLLEPFQARLAFVNTASSSGGFLEALSAPGRVVVTATSTAREQNETVFPRYFADAFVGEDADTDKDGRVSILEAFEYARREVARAYAADDLLLTEHARIEDDGDGEPSEAGAPDAGDGRVASGLYLDLGSGARGAQASGVPADASPELRALYARRDSLESRVQALRGQRSTMEPETYEAALEELLVDLALTNREIRAHEGGEP